MVGNSEVTPIAHENGVVICSCCGHEMKPWSYTSFPWRTKHILWRCEKNPDHISAMLPLPNTADGNDP